jgi:hypothetical protein
MTPLYKSALVTIVASGASDASQDCLFPKNSTRQYVNVSVSVPPSRDISTVTFATHSGSVADDFLNSP